MSAMLTLLGYYDAKPNPNTDFAESVYEQTIHNPANQTAVGVTITLLTQVVITAGSGSIGFPGLDKLNSGLLIDAYRRASTHGYDPNSYIAQKQSLDTLGDTWGPETILLNTPGIDDRDCQWWAWNGQRYFGSYWYTGTDLVSGSMQAFAGTGPNSVFNIAGFPLSGLARRCTNRPLGYDTNKIILNGGQWPFGSVGSWREAGLVDLAAGTIRWLRSSQYQLDESAILDLGNGNLLTAQRGQNSSYANAALLVSLSANDGNTWGPWQVFPFPCGGPNLLLHSSGVIVLAFREYDGATVHTSLVWSNDGGLTWSAVIRIFTCAAGDCGYPTMRELDDGSVYISWYQGATIYGRRFTIS